MPRPLQNKVDCRALMSQPSRDKPLLVFDADCNFCRLWIDRWKSADLSGIEFVAFQDVAHEFPRLPLEDFKKSLQLIDPQGNVVGGAQAVFTMLSLTRGTRWLLWMYRCVPGVALLSECYYRFVAKRRNAFFRLTRLLWGSNIRIPEYHLAQWLFLRGMGLVYLVAFLSLSTQILGLVGAQGILPAHQFLDAVHQQLGSRAYRLIPTLVWLDSGDGFLSFLCIGGVVLSVLFLIGLFQKPAAFLLWAFYFSLYAVGQDFLSFQWDILLLEAGFLTVILAPFGILPGRSPPRPPSRMLLWLPRLLLFRLMFQSGVVKLTSGDPSWSNLTALTFHFETQCIPTPVAWYAHLMPLWFQQFAVAVMFAVELVIPFLIFMPRRLRMLGAWFLIAFQLLIILTGNYAFFNYLTIVLCLALFDDASIRRVIRRGQARVTSSERVNRPMVLRCIRDSFAAVMVVFNVAHLAGLFIRPGQMPDTAAALIRWSSMYNIVNSYGLFRVMTTSRPEIIVEGSNDGGHWFAYEFTYKPGDTLRAPPWVAPHQPRLDWQMWFAALGEARENRWFMNFMVRILQGSPDVVALLAQDPFHGMPPRYVRALVYDYRFTNAAERNKTGAYWYRKYRGIYLPATSLRRE